MPTPVDSPSHRRTPPAAAPRPDPARLGRRIAASLYWVLTAYVIGCGFASVIPQVFWPAEALGIPQVAEGSACPAALGALRQELLDGAAERVRNPRPGAVRPWLDAWDERYRRLEGVCGHVRSYSLLARLRYGIEEDLLRFEASRAALATETLAAIQREAR